MLAGSYDHVCIIRQDHVKCEFIARVIYSSMLQILKNLEIIHELCF